MVDGVDLFSNDAQTTLSSSVTAAATTIFVASSSQFPSMHVYSTSSASAVPQFRALISDATNGDEIVIVTAFVNSSSTNWQVTRGAEGTAAVAHASGCTVSALLTAGALQNDRRYNVVDYGATGDGATDDSAAIRAALSACSAGGGGTVFLPNGTYIVSLGTDGLGSCLMMPANTTLRGESTAGAIVMLAAAQPASTRPIVIQTANVRIASLTIDGNKAGQEDDNEHRAAIFLLSSTYVGVEDVILQNNTGDGIQMSIASYTTMQRCQFLDCDRNGLTIGEGPTSYVSVRDCYFAGSGSQFHIEAAELSSGIWFENSYCGPGLDHNPSCSIGNSSSDVTFRNLRIFGALQIAQTQRVVVENCYIEAGEDDAGPCPLTILEGSVDVVVQNCVIYQSAAQGSQIFTLFARGAEDNGAQPENITIANNHIVTANAGSWGVYLNNTSDVTVRDNKIENSGDGSTLAAICTFGSDFNYPEPLQGNTFVRGNHIYNWGIGIYAGLNASGQSMAALEIQNNFIEVPAGFTGAVGYLLSLPDPPNPPLGPSQCTMVGNSSANLTTVISAYPACPILIGGTRGGGGMYSITGAPNDSIGNPTMYIDWEIAGATAIQRDGTSTTAMWILGTAGWLKVTAT